MISWARRLYGRCHRATTQPRAARSLAAADQAAIGTPCPEGDRGVSDAHPRLWAAMEARRYASADVDWSARCPFRAPRASSRDICIMSVVSGGAVSYVRSALQLAPPQASPPPPHYSARCTMYMFYLWSGHRCLAGCVCRHATRAAGLCAAWAGVGALCRPYTCPQNPIRLSKKLYICLQRPPRLIQSDVGRGPPNHPPTHRPIAVRDPSEFGGPQKWSAPHARRRRWHARCTPACSRGTHTHPLGRAPTLVVILISEMAGSLYAHDGSVGWGGLRSRRSENGRCIKIASDRRWGRL